MKNTAPPATATLSDMSAEEIESAVADAHLPSLLTTLAYLTGDMELLRPEMAPSSHSLTLALDRSGGLTPEIAEKARRLAAQTLLQYRERLSEAPPIWSTDELKRIMEFTTGPVDEAYVPLLLHELGLPVDTGAPAWNKEEIAPERDFSVIVVGAGMSGIAAARRLQQAGVSFTVIERNEDVGGVWLDNNYPGAKLDTSNFTYSYSFAQHGLWADQYSSQEEILDYFRQVADRFSLNQHISFGITVIGGEFDRATGSWSLRLRSSSGQEWEATCDVLISAVGQLNEPNVPELPGAETFEGVSWHTAKWNHDVDLRGKCVAVIGTGASAFQVIPKVAEVASQLTVFQRTPAWVIPTPDYNAPIASGQHVLFELLPSYHRWYRFNQFWVNVDGIRHLARVDPEWDHPVSVSEANEGMRRSLTEFLEDAFADRPDILEQIVPEYPPYAKRTVRDDGNWTSALKRANVTLTSSPISTLAPKGVTTADGITHEVDAIVYGTGFKASSFLSTLPLSVRDGLSLDEFWQGDARAYYGSMIPHFPNLFCVYGPNTNLNVNGSTVLFSEASVEFALNHIEILLRDEKRLVEVKEAPYWEYNATIDAASKQLAVGASEVSSWYKNAFGRNSQNWPLTTLEFWQGTHSIRSEDYEWSDLA